MIKKIFVCITLLTNITTYSMLIKRLNTVHTIQQKKHLHNAFYADPIMQHLNSCPPAVAVEKIVTITLAPLQFTHEEKTGYVKNLLGRTDMSTEQYKTLYLLQQFLDRKKSHPFCDQDHTLIHTAIRKNNAPLLKTTLTYSSKNSVNLPDKQGNSALYYASSKALIPLIQILLEHRPNVNIQNDRGLTPLHGAVLSSLINTSPEKNNLLLKTIQCLKDFKANPTIKDNYDKRPLDYVYKSIENLDTYRSQTIHNKHNELTEVYYEMEKLLKHPEQNE